MERFDKVTASESLESAHVSGIYKLQLLASTNGSNYRAEHESQ